MNADVIMAFIGQLDEIRKQTIAGILCATLEDVSNVNSPYKLHLPPFVLLRQLNDAQDHLW